MSFFGLTFFGPPSPFTPYLAGVQNLNNYDDATFQSAFDSVKDSNGTIDVADLRILLSRVFKAEPNAGDLKSLQGLLEAGDASELKAKPALAATAHLASSSVDTLTMAAIAAIKEQKIAEEKQSSSEANQTNQPAKPTEHAKRVNWEQFYSALRIARAQRASAGSQGSCEFSSSHDYRQKLRAHKRVQLDPQEKYTAPMTSAQEYGWFTQTSVERTARKPNISCPETRYASELVRSGIFY